MKRDPPQVFLGLNPRRGQSAGQPKKEHFRCTAIRFRPLRVKLLNATAFSFGMHSLPSMPRHRSKM